MATELDVLPEALRRLAEEVDLNAAIGLADWHGGRRLWVPLNPVPDDHPLAVNVGRKGANWLVREYGGDYLDIPKAAAWLRAKRDTEIRAKFARKSCAQLALEHGLTERTIWRILSGGDEGDSPQQSLI